MRKCLYLFIALVAFVATSCNKNLEEGSLEVSATTIEFSGDAETKTLTVTSTGTWAMTKSSGASWCTPSRTFGKGETVVELTVTANTPKERLALLEIRSEGCSPVKVLLKQAPGTAEGGEEEEEILVSPDPASGITVDPAYPDAD